MGQIAERMNTTDDCLLACPICAGPIIEKKLKGFCQNCGQLCHTCCDPDPPG